MIIAFHLQVEDFGLAGGSRRDEIGVEEVKDAGADIGEFGLNLGSVVLDECHVFLVLASFFLLFDGGDDAPRGTEGAYNVLVGDGEEVALFHGELR